MRNISCLILFLFLLHLIPAFASAQGLIFEERFESASWATMTGKSALSLSSEKTHSGMSSLAVNKNNSGVFKDIPAFTSNTLALEAWLYDDYNNINQQVVISAGPAASDIKFFMGICPSTIDGSYDKYCIRRSTGGWTVTNVPRSTGWHQFIMEFNISTSSVTFYIDGIATTPTPYTDASVTIANLKQKALGGFWATPGMNPPTVFIDDVRLWNNVSDIPSGNKLTDYTVTGDCNLISENPVDITQKKYQISINPGDIYIEFNHEMNLGTLSGKVLLTDENGNHIELEAVGDGNKKLKISVKNTLSYESKYYLTLSQKISDLQMDCYLLKDYKFVLITEPVPLKIHSLQLADKNGTVLQSLNGQTEVMARVEIENKSLFTPSGPQKILLLAAAYKSDEGLPVLSDIKCWEQEISDNTELIPVTTPIILLGEDDEYVSVFLWDDLKNKRILYPSFDIHKN